VPVYRVLHSHIHHDGEVYAPGDTIELTGEQAGMVSVEPLPEGRQEPAKGKVRK
jgi:hypothetical protein